MTLDFKDLSYLLKGSERQRLAYEAIRDSRIFYILRDYSPILAGTIPIGVDVESSDLDIVCEVYDLDHFIQYMLRTLRHYDPLTFMLTVRDAVPTLLVNFHFKGFPFQVIAKPLPSELQNPYRHMVVEHRLLSLAGEGARQAIRELQMKTGLKTEPAFAQYFRLDGDPYQALLDLEPLGDDQLMEIVARAQR